MFQPSLHRGPPRSRQLRRSAGGEDQTPLPTPVRSGCLRRRRRVRSPFADRVDVFAHAGCCPLDYGNPQLRSMLYELGQGKPGKPRCPPNGDALLTVQGGSERQTDARLVENRIRLQMYQDRFRPVAVQHDHRVLVRCPKRRRRIALELAHAHGLHHVLIVQQEPADSFEPVSSVARPSSRTVEAPWCLGRRNAVRHMHLSRQVTDSEAVLSPAPSRTGIRASLGDPGKSIRSARIPQLEFADRHPGL